MTNNNDAVNANANVTEQKENQMTNNNELAAARRDYDNADKAFNSNPTVANLASYEIARKALLAAKAAAGISTIAAVDEEDEDERPFPDSDEAIRALQDDADELEAECYRLRAELKTSNAERDEARREVCESEKYCLEEAKKRGWDCFKKEEQTQ
jgi:hypothetical protein